MELLGSVLLLLLLTADLSTEAAAEAGGLRRMPDGCQCVGTTAYGGTCARWDAPDEQYWCHVRTREACGPAETFVSGGKHWSHLPCHGRGRFPGGSGGTTASLFFFFATTAGS